MTATPALYVTSRSTKSGSSASPEAGLEMVLDCYSKDEWGDALLFAHLFQGECVYDHIEKEWYIWQRHYWKRDDVGRIRQLVAGRLASVYLKASADLNVCLSEHTVPSQGKGAPGMQDEGESDLGENRALKKLVKGAGLLQSRNSFKLPNKQATYPDDRQSHA